jgi:uncharacterized protein YjbI with pentapeptide repeats
VLGENGDSLDRLLMIHLNWRKKASSHLAKEEKQSNLIEQVAWELYENRYKHRRPPNKDDIWQEASKIVQSPLRTSLFASNRPFTKLIKPSHKILRFLAIDFPRWFAYSLPEQAWVKLLAVPLTIALATNIIGSKLQEEANQIKMLEEYFNQLEVLAFEQDLIDENPSSEATLIARGKTVTALRKLDIERKAQLIGFLQASGLLQANNEELEPIISFKQQNLSNLELKSIDFRRAVFEESLLSRANLKGADLSFANIQEADLSQANLSGAILYNTNLMYADLTKANLRGAILSEAKLQEAILFGTNLKGANLSQANLDYVKLCQTILPEDITLDPDRDCHMLQESETGDPTHPIP